MMPQIEPPLPGQIAWRALAWFNLYRFLLGFLFVTLDIAGQLPHPLGSYDRNMFATAAILYLFLSILFTFFIRLERPPYLFQVITHVIVDILVITVLMFASAGLNSGFGVLLVIAVAGGGILFSHKIGFFFASVATLSVLSHEVFAQLNWDLYSTNYTQAGFLGISFFVTAFISNFFAVRVQQSEELAKQRGLDLEKVSRLNDHIVQRLQSGIIVLDDKLQIQLVNEAAMSLLNIDSKNIIRKHLETISPYLSDCIRSWINSSGDMTAIFTTNPGGIEVQASFSEMESGAMKEYLLFIEDTATLKQRAQQMKLASLGRLTGSIAHEVRNPLGAISHASQLLSESSEFSDEDKRLTNIIVEHSNRVNRIIENIMNISRRNEVSLETINLCEWITGFIEEFSQQKKLRSDDIKLVINNPEIIVQTDPQQLHQIMWNICENGIRYSEAKPLLRIICDIQSDTMRPVINIEDQGPGIGEDDREKLFEPFFTTSQTGSGLGLYIARELCEANQATLTLIDSTNTEDASGCCFRITFSHPDKQHSLI